MSDRKEIRVIGYLHISRYNSCWSALHRNMLEIQSPIFRWNSKLCAKSLFIYTHAKAILGSMQIKDIWIWAKPLHSFSATDWGRKNISPMLACFVLNEKGLKEGLSNGRSYRLCIYFVFCVIVFCLGVCVWEREWESERERERMRERERSLCIKIKLHFQTG